MTALNESIKHIPMPARIRKLPISDKGFPVPWFVPWRDAEPVVQASCPVKRSKAMRFDLCWICGEQLGKHKAFVLGPMCMVNKITSEPPSHLECAEYAVKACPFLAKPKMRRNPTGLPDDKLPAPGIMIERNPGVVVIWVTKSWGKMPDGKGGVLISVGPPEQIKFYREGRTAERSEIMESIDSGMPLLRKHAYTLDARQALDMEYREAVSLLPPI